MKRSFLIALGLEKEVIDNIMSEHGNTVELIKEKAKEDAEKQAEKLTKKNESLQEKINNMPKPDPDGKDWKAEHEALQKKYDTDISAKEAEQKKVIAEKEAEYQKAITAKDTEFSTFKAGVEGKELVSKKRDLARKYLVDEKKMNAVAFDKLIHKEIDYDKMELDGNSVKSADDYFKEYQEKFSEFIGTTTTTGTTTETPPVGDQTKPETKTLGEALKEKYNKG